MRVSRWNSTCRTLRGHEEIGMRNAHPSNRGVYAINSAAVNGLTSSSERSLTIAAGSVEVQSSPRAPVENGGLHVQDFAE